jgi:hypothetical protein
MVFERVMHDWKRDRAARADANGDKCKAIFLGEVGESSDHFCCGKKGWVDACNVYGRRKG